MPTQELGSYPPGVIFQLGFFGEVKPLPEESMLGSSATEVFKQVIRLHPEIAKTSYIIQDLRAFPKKSPRKVLLREQGLNGGLRGAEDALPVFSPGQENQWVVRVCSSVVLHDGSMAHIPMLDFARDIACRDIDTACSALTGYPGYILDTGNSYQFLGTEVLDTMDWRRFLERASGSRLPHMFENNYVNVSREWGFSLLRVTANPPTEPVEPKVVATVGL